MNINQRISIIIVNFNGLKDTLELLSSIDRFLNHDFVEVIVVDNGSVIDETIRIKSIYPNTKTIRSNQNLGFAGGNNLGIKESVGEYIILLNNDTLLIDNSLMQVPALLEIDGSVGVISPKILFLEPSGYIQYAGYSLMSSITIRNKTIGFMEKDNGVHDLRLETPYSHGAAMILRRNVIEKVGLMPEVFFLYYEEMDWCEQIRAKGIKIMYEPAITIIHKEGMSVGKQSPMKKYYMVRNRLLFAKRNRKGVLRMLSVFYQLFIAVPKDIALLVIKGEVRMALASLKGAISFLI
ncbi:MAG: glycosyltransferase family 2 protein [Bacteroidales bacterium]|jgi:GT2 family glycosyltransferase|nr:glycosyltransferase family 2 protein [Bacteroidales bacterium]